MSIEAAARKLLLADSSIASAIAGRIRPRALAQSDPLPGIVYHEIDSPSEEHLRGGAGLAHTRIQFDCIAATRSQALYLRELVRLVLQGIRGTVEVGESRVEITGTSVGTRRGEYDPPTDGSDQGSYVAMIDILFSHREPVRSFTEYL